MVQLVVILGKINRKKKDQQVVANGKPASPQRDVLTIFGVTAILAFILQKIQLYIDWDTLASVLTMNTAGYSPLTSPPSHYHVLIEPLVYVLTALSSPLLGHDHLNGYILVTAVFAGGLLALVYYLVYQVTGHRSAAWISTAFLGVSLNFIFLTLSSEDNIINQFFNLLAIFLVIVSLGIVKTKLDQRVVAALLGISIGLAIGTNLRSVYLIVLLPLIVILSKERAEGLKKAGYAVLSTSIAVVCMVVASIVLAKKALSLEEFLNFFRVDYYGDPRLWYFADPSQNVVLQLTLASRGFLRSLFGDYLWTVLNGISPWLSVVVVAIVLIVFGAVLLSRWRDPVVILLATLFLLNSVNSFFYEPYSMERWDHAVLLLGLLAGVVWSSKPKSSEKYAIVSIVAIGAIGTILFLLTMSSLTSFVAFSYEKTPAGMFQENPGLVMTGQKDMNEAALYLRYLYGKDNVVFINDTVPTQDVLAYLKTVDGTVYYDAGIYYRCEEYAPGDEFLARSPMIGTADLPWFVSLRS